jgi:hypothetical protein
MLLVKSSGWVAAVFTVVALPVVLGTVGCDADGGDGSATGGSGQGGTAPTGDVTFHKDVEPILQKSCLGCHYEGKIGGFSLLDYETAKPLASAMAAAVEEGRMPPWGAHDTDECQPSRPWRNDLRLPAEEVALLRAWADGGAPKGDPAHAPPAYVPPADGLANKSLEIPAPVASTIEGSSDQFTCVVYDPQLTEEKWVDGIHFIAGNTKVDHHALTFRVPRDRAQELSGGAPTFPCFGGAPGEIIHVWAPGTQPFELPADVGIKLSPDEVVVVQMHYHPTGSTTETDQSTVQLRFRDETPSWEFYVLFPGNAEDAGDGLLPGPNDGAAGPEFRIPANVSDHVEKMVIQVPNEVILDLPILMVMAHMHYVGVDLKFEIERASPPEGQAQKECLLQNPAWDFGWQRFYQFDVPIEDLPTAKAGDTLTLTCKYNNTMTNPFVSQALADQGMSAPIEVTLGEETLDEMCLAPVGVLVPAGIL